MRAAFVASAATLVLIGCSTNSKSLSNGSTLAPLETSPVPTTTTTSTAPDSTSTPTVVAVATTAPTTDGPAATMTPPTVSAGSTPATTTPAATTVASVAPDTTVLPETTAVPEPPATTAGPTTCDSCRPDYVFPYASFFAVPQLGAEAVRGTGCGANGSIGEVVPDGIWEGHITIARTSLKIDLQCVYYGASAAPYVAQCEQTQDADTCLEYGDDFWIVNNSTRLRTVPLDPGFRHRYATADGCADPGPGRGATGDVGADAMDSWIVIHGGTATFALTSCVYG